MGVGVVVLDQQPVVSLAALAVLFHPYKDETAAQPLTLQHDLEIALPQALARIGPGLRRPVATVPQHYRAAAVLSLRDRAFEVAIVERVVLDLHRQTANLRVQRRALGHRPGLEHPVELQAEVVVQPRRLVLLDHEAQAVRGARRFAPARLGGLREVADRLVAGELSGHGERLVRRTSWNGSLSVRTGNWLRSLDMARCGLDAERANAAMRSHEPSRLTQGIARWPTPPSPT